MSDITYSVDEYTQIIKSSQSLSDKQQEAMSVLIGQVPFSVIDSIFNVSRETLEGLDEQKPAPILESETQREPETQREIESLKAQILALQKANLGAEQVTNQPSVEERLIRMFENIL